MLLILIFQMGKLKHKQLLAIYRFPYLYWEQEVYWEVWEIHVLCGQDAAPHVRKSGYGSKQVT